MRKNIHALLVPVLLLSFLVFSGWAAYQAATRVSEVSDRDYYSKGLRYNNTLLEKRAASVMGWQLRSELHQGTLTQFLVDTDGKPVSGAKGTLFFASTRDSSLLTIPLTETAPGIYSASLPLVAGEHLVRADFERDGARISRRILLTI
ncbi:MAG: FixH family protein [Pelovirga sp.]